MTALTAKQLKAVEDVKDVEAAAMQLAEDLKYPIDAHGRILDMNHLPDVAVTLVHHLIRRGWRFHPEKALIKPRRVVGAGYYEDLVTYVGVDESDEPVVVKRQPETQEPWSVKPIVNMIDEPRPTDD